MTCAIMQMNGRGMTKLDKRILAQDIPYEVSCVFNNLRRN